MSERSEGGSISSEHVVPETLLAIAKDMRYVKECEALLLKALLVPFVSPRDIERWEPTAGFISAVLYAVLVLARKKRTAGMEVCGIEFSNNNNSDVMALAAGALVSAVWVYGIRWGAAVAAAAAATPTQNGLNSSESLTGAQRRRVFEQQRQEMMRRAINRTAAVGSAITPPQR